MGLYAINDKVTWLDAGVRKVGRIFEVVQPWRPARSLNAGDCSYRIRNYEWYVTETPDGRFHYPHIDALFWYIPAMHDNPSETRARMRALGMDDATIDRWTNRRAP